MSQHPCLTHYISFAITKKNMHLHWATILLLSLLLELPLLQELPLLLGLLLPLLLPLLHVPLGNSHQAKHNLKLLPFEPVMRP
jgi:hypothetical protein